VTMAGDGVCVYNDLFSQLLGDTAELLPWISTPSAVNIGLLASSAQAAGNYLDLDRAAPEYVRSSDAQLSLVSPLKSG
jgi:tRNA threonylcarbamoyladenosine biosynthesis protein TsaB